ncbi:MAG TPA: glycosyltransferase family 39 protein [Chryseosolibacter sp.]|nr:glycosyltransferase family 39 protein [Chryseosolibacter sp.]
MKKYLWILIGFILLKFSIHAVGNFNYGYQRDELLHLAVGQHLDWGFMEFPPFIAVLGKFAHIFFDDNLWLTRLFPTLSGIAILVFCVLIAKDLGGKTAAIFLAGICVLSFLPFYRNHTLFQPVAFEQLFWTVGFYVLVRMFNTGNEKLLMLLGVVAGFAILNKYTSLVWIFSIAAGLLFFDRARVFKSRWIYIGGIIAGVMILPNIWWQYGHGFPLLRHLEALKNSQLEEIGYAEFLLDQTGNLFTFIVSVIGLYGFLFNEALKKYRVIGIAILVLFAVLWMQMAKGYYFFGVYPMLFAAGAVMTERIFSRKPIIVYAYGIVIFFISTAFIPGMTPVLPIDVFVDYTNKPIVNGRVALTSDYADMFGWTEQVALIDSVYRNLSTEEKAKTTIVASNYGEAGAVMIVGKKYQLPHPICTSGSFWLWGPGNAESGTFICLGFDDETINRIFGSVQLIKIIKHRYAVDEENNISLLLCRDPKINLVEEWPAFERYIFD